jgi:hypothetical protein
VNEEDRKKIKTFIQEYLEGSSEEVKQRIEFAAINREQILVLKEHIDTIKAEFKEIRKDFNERVAELEIFAAAAVKVAEKDLPNNLDSAKRLREVESRLDKMEGKAIGISAAISIAIALISTWVKGFKP